MSRSKLSMLSSSTVHLELEDIKTPISTVSFKTPEKATGPSPLNTDSSPLLHTPLESTKESSSHEDTMTLQSSSFKEELISHFERRLSDLGPRSKYPYLQQLDKQQAKNSGSSLGSGAGSQSEEMLPQMRVCIRVPEERRRGKWWKYSNASSSSAARQGLLQGDRSHASHVMALGINAGGRHGGETSQLQRAQEKAAGDGSHSGDGY